MPFDGYPSAEFTAKNRGKFDLSSYQKMVLFDSISAKMALFEKIDMCRFTVLFLWFSIENVPFYGTFQKNRYVPFYGTFRLKMCHFYGTFQKKNRYVPFLWYIFVCDLGIKKCQKFNLTGHFLTFQCGWKSTKIGTLVILVNVYWNRKSAVDMALFWVSVVIHYSNTIYNFAVISRYWGSLGYGPKTAR